MRQIIKLLDVPADRIAPLFQVLQGAEFMRYIDVMNQDLRLAKILTVKSKNGGSYVVEIEVRVEYPLHYEYLGNGLHGDSFVLTPINVIEAIYRALGIFPDEDKQPSPNSSSSLHYSKWL
jgi:hypothetical protein